MFGNSILEFGKRRVQKNHYSYSIPLPKMWVKTMGIQKGDFVRIEMTDDQELRVISCREDNVAGDFLQVTPGPITTQDHLKKAMSNET